MSVFITLAIVSLAVTAISITLLKLDDLFGALDRHPTEDRLHREAPHPAHPAPETHRGSTPRPHRVTPNRPFATRSARTAASGPARSGAAAARRGRSRRQIPVPPLAG